MFLRIVATDFLTARRRNPKEGSFNALDDHHLYVLLSQNHYREGEFAVRSR
jgi:hypothetical protein